MKRLTCAALVSASTLMLAGCAAFVAPRYVPPLPERSKVSGISLLDITGAATLPLCRGAHTVSPPDGMTLPQYVRQAVQVELQRDDPSPLVLVTGQLASADFSTSPLSTEDMTWSLSLLLRSADGRERTVSIKRSFPPETARPDDYVHCSLIARQLLPAVQDLAVAAAGVLREWAGEKQQRSN